MISWEEGTGVEKGFGVKHAQSWALQGWVTPGEEGCWGEKNSRVNGAQAWAIQGWMTS